MKELFFLRQRVPQMNAEQKEDLKDKTLLGIKNEVIKCCKKGMTLGQILEPSYKNKQFMNILFDLGIDADELKNIVMGYMDEYEKGAEEREIEKDIADKNSFGTLAKESAEITKKGARLTFLKSAPFIVSREKIWEEYGKFINSLSQETFDHRIIDVIKMLNYGGNSASEYKNSQEHLEVTIKRWPRLTTYKDALLEWIKQCRKDNGFKE